MTPLDVILKYNGDELVHDAWAFDSVKDAKEAHRELERKFPGQFIRSGNTITKQ